VAVRRIAWPPAVRCPTGASTPAAAAAPVTVPSAFGAAGLSPTAPVTITVAHGTITALQVTNPEGTAVTGTMSPDGTSWTLGEPLGYGKTYTVSGPATGTDGQAVPVTGTYTTVTPAGEVTTGISPAPGSTVGVAAPVIVSLGSAPADRAPIESHVHITTEHWAVRISDNGEFIHQNQDTVADQGNTNVSHGCINLSADTARAYHDSAIYGDPVEVTGSSVPLSAADGDIYDWAIPWEQWLTMSGNGAAR